MVIEDCRFCSMRMETNPDCTICNGTGIMPPTTEQIAQMRSNALRTLAEPTDDDPSPHLRLVK